MKFYLDKRRPFHAKTMYNTVVNWAGSDTPENFYKYQPNPYNLDSITYEYNKFGFRSDDFDQPADKKIIFIGCSFTEGIGLPNHHTWSYQLLEMIKAETGLTIPYWNLGMGSCGIGSITRILYHWYPLLNPDLVVALWPGYRHEYKTKLNKWHTVLPNKTPNIFETNPFLIESTTIQYETEKNFAIIDLLLQRNNSILIWDFWSQQESFMTEIEMNLETFKNRVDLWKGIEPTLLIKPGHEKPVKARDGMHPGEEYNKRFANQLFAHNKDLILRSLS